MRITVPDYFPVEIDLAEINDIGNVYALLYDLVEIMKEHSCRYATSADGARIDLEDLDTMVEQLRTLFYHIPIKIE